MFGLFKKHKQEAEATIKEREAIQKFDAKLAKALDAKNPAALPSVDDLKKYAKWDHLIQVIEMLHAASKAKPAPKAAAPKKPAAKAEEKIISTVKPVETKPAAKKPAVEAKPAAKPVAKAKPKVEPKK